MLFEMTLVPVGSDAHVSDEIASAIKIVEAAGLPFQLTPSATCIEGDWDEVMPIIQRCHQNLRRHAPHVVTLIKVEDEEDADNMLEKNVASVEEKVGHQVHGTNPVNDTRSVAGLKERELEETPV